MENKNPEKMEEENDEDNMGRDNYFMLDRKNDSDDSNLLEESSEKIIPNVNNYLNNDDTPEIQDIIDNPQINPNKCIINNKIESNINMENNNYNINESINITNNICDKKFFNNNDLSNKDKINQTNCSKFIPINNNENEENRRSFNSKDKANEKSKKENMNEIIEKISSDEEEDLNIIPNEQFVKHFQSKYEPKRNIEVIDTNNTKKNNNFDEILKNNCQKKYQEEDKIFNSFFMEKDKKNNNIIEMPKKNKKNMNYNIYRNKNNIRSKDFWPLPKDEFKPNTHFQKLLINRVEHQILTNIYNSYENKEKFKQTYYYINEIKKKITHESVEEAIKFLDNIEPMELRAKVAIESTYFFKEIVREEVENAKVHNGELILIKQSESYYNQHMKLSGTINHNNDFRRKGNSIMRNPNYNYHINNFEKKQFKERLGDDNEEYEHYNVNYNRIYNNPLSLRQQLLPKNKIQNYDADEE